MTGASRRRAVFLDRDGILNALVTRDGLAASPQRATDFKILPGVAEAVARLRSLGYLVFVTSNQPDVARGLLSREDLDQMTAALRAAVPLDEVAVCPHDDADRCTCRKPLPGMLTGLAERWSVDLAASYMVGDSWKDVEAGRAAACRTIYVGPPGQWRSPPDVVAGSLPEAVARIADGV